MLGEGERGRVVVGLAAEGTVCSVWSPVNISDIGPPGST